MVYMGLAARIKLDDDDDDDDDDDTATAAMQTKFSTTIQPCHHQTTHIHWITYSK